jgi:hypothetical protein
MHTVLINLHIVTIICNIHVQTKSLKIVTRDLYHKNMLWNIWGVTFFIIGFDLIISFPTHTSIMALEVVRNSRLKIRGNSFPSLTSKTRSCCLSTQIRTFSFFL